MPSRQLDRADPSFVLGLEALFEAGDKRRHAVAEASCVVFGFDACQSTILYSNVEIGIETERLAEIAIRAGQIAGPVAEDTSKIEGRGVVGFEANNLIIVRDCGGEVVLSPVCVGSVEECGVEGGIELYRLVVVLERANQVRRGFPLDATIVEGHSEGGIEANGLVVEVNFFNGGRGAEGTLEPLLRGELVLSDDRGFAGR